MWWFQLFTNCNINEAMVQNMIKISNGNFNKNIGFEVTDTGGYVEIICTQAFKNEEYKVLSSLEEPS